jgi:hypothetical protein
MIFTGRQPKKLLALVMSVLAIFMYGIIIPDISYAAIGTTYYVSTIGSDSNNGTFDAPWKTIQKACNTVIAGDTVCIEAGTYKGKISIPTSGT